MSKSATLYRMETDAHTCPFGLRAKDLLRRNGFQIDDKILTSRAEVDELKSKLDVKTTPQIIINDKRIGGFEDLQRHLGIATKDKNKTTYFPVMAVFGVAALLACAIAYPFAGELEIQTLVMHFIGLSMIMLGLLKLQNLQAFVNGFLGYDLLARRYVPYAFTYPYAEVLGGLLMVAGTLSVISIPIMLFIGGIGGVSVIKAVYIDKRELKCACVGGDSNVPLGFVSFSENAVMFGAAIWMLFHQLFI
ncbi:glutaredoxin domain-containing protein [Alteromonas sp. ASW11-36]|uniref:Methylamine utilization protein MauE n=1 Tax=Alteromonas arenosi TaxID=3055817 RepID=A0ABT7SUS0_9ALTE|nr:MauE/DoxX family redox-associated membrane protein [Alteromonas sp. ASW11-36]MDM7859932.1 glutaredoxin domain-containing protein [Alteromonas sp. ASW11-36]